MEIIRVLKCIESININGVIFLKGCAYRVVEESNNKIVIHNHHKNYNIQFSTLEESPDYYKNNFKEYKSKSIYYILNR